MKRAIFVHQSRIADLVLTLKFDDFVAPADKTYIFYSGDSEQHLLSVLALHDIDTSNFEILLDRHYWNSTQCRVQVYQFGGWIYQQLLKLWALDTLPWDDVLLIQDCDTFLTEYYNWHDATMFYVPNRTAPQDYDQWNQLLVGQDFSVQPRRLYVSEFMPVTKSAWLTLKQRIEEQHDMPWLEAMHRIFERNTVPHVQIWFSEYELLGNWSQKQRPTQVIPQRRFEMRESDWRQNLHTLPNYNAVCNYSQIPLGQVGSFAQNIRSMLVDQ